ncbi:unnamed protein product [Hermetia illucens]|uniref:Zinc carboxypeptidase A 1 n=1 Tax=Hermetia illucens TaxID=343691 RepID=A0A7R8UTD1_HERIL|nr:zinc carboxypeptidase A 1-like [Hermetia illucens]CAD7086390.1 unnamed protein product [Hermetia illucens]
MSRFVLAIGLSLLVGLIGAERVRYDNYNVYKVIPQTPEQLDLFARLEVSSDSLKFFDPIVAVDKEIHVLVAPHKEPEFLDILKDNAVQYELAVKNFQRILDEEQLEMNKARARGIYDWTSYHTLDENYEWLRSLAQQYPDKVELIKAGSSYEGRDLLGIKISFKSGNKGVFIEGGIHAREWISPATVTYITNQLLTSSDAEVRALAERYDWYIVPHVNPDGYVYTHNKERLWRKTRSKGSSCYGADANRNWGFHWKEVGASSSECSETYAGKSAFSEVETQSLSKYISSLKGKISVYLAFHSFSQLMLFPYGHTSAKAPNHNDLNSIADAAATALAKRYGTKYKYGNTYAAIYPAAGSSVDWAYGEVGIKVAYTYELRPSSSSSNGFVLAASQIIPTGQETVDSLIALFKAAESKGY